MIWLDEQLQQIYFLQEWRGPVVDSIFRFLNLFDTDYFASVLVVFVWLGCSWRWGVRMGFLLIASSWINAIAKWTFASPRPFFFDPSIAIVRIHDYGFPSGGAQNAMLFGCLIIYCFDRRWAWPAGIFYFILIGFSRIFLGVHFPIDVLGGWCLGAFVFAAFIKTVRPIEAWAARHSEPALGLCLAIAVAAIFASQNYKTVFLMTSLAAAAAGVYFSTRYSLYLAAPRTTGKIIGLGVFGIVSTAFVALFARMLPLDPLFSNMAKVALPGLWISLAASPFCKKAFGVR